MGADKSFFNKHVLGEESDIAGIIGKYRP